MGLEPTEGLKPIEIARLTSCTEEELGRVAKGLKLEVPSAVAIRRNWILQLTGRCLQCEAVLDGNKCTRCTSTIDLAPKERVMQTLAKIAPYMVVIRRECRCGQIFTYMAKYMYTKAKEYNGNFQASSMCRACKLKREESKRISKSSKKRKPAQKRKPIQPIENTAPVKDPTLVEEDPLSDTFKNSIKDNPQSLQEISKAMSNLFSSNG